MLKHSEVREDFHSKNIDKAREKLNIMKMDAESRKKYERYLENLAYEKDVVETAKEDGRNEERQNTEREKQRAERAEKEKEREKQRAEQEKQKLDSAILKMVNRNVFSIEEIADDFNVTVEYIKQILPISDPKTILG